MRIAAGCLALLCLPVIPAVAANIVVNPGFETGDLTGWTLTPATVGSTFVVANLFPANSGGFAANFGGVQVGDYDVISQTLPTTAGHTYTFSFFMGASGPNNRQQAFWDGINLQDLMDFSQGYVQYTFTQVATTNSTVIAFGGYNVPNWNGVDDVVVQDLAPEPSTWVLVAGASGLLALRRKRHLKG